MATLIPTRVRPALRLFADMQPHQAAEVDADALAWLHFADAVRRIAGEDGWWEAASALPTLLRDLERQPHVAGPWYSDPDGVAEARFDFEKEGR
jgi:hypothetical protein